MKTTKYTETFIYRVATEVLKSNKIKRVCKRQQWLSQQQGKHSAYSSMSSMAVDILNIVSNAVTRNCPRQRSACTHCRDFHSRLEDDKVLVSQTVFSYDSAFICECNHCKLRIWGNQLRGWWWPVGSKVVSTRWQHQSQKLWMAFCMSDVNFGPK
jgi:hypothetical protein